MVWYPMVALGIFFALTLYLRNRILIVQSWTTHISSQLDQLQSAREIDLLERKTRAFRWAYQRWLASVNKNQRKVSFEKWVDTVDIADSLYIEAAFNRIPQIKIRSIRYIDWRTGEDFKEQSWVPFYLRDNPYPSWEEQNS